MPRPSVPGWNELDRAMKLLDITDPPPLDLPLVMTGTKTQDRTERALPKCDSKESNIELEAELIFDSKSTEKNMEETTDDDNGSNKIIFAAEEFTRKPIFYDEEQVDKSNKTDSEITELVVSDNNTNEVEVVDILDGNSDNITELIAEEFIISDTNTTEVNILDIVQLNNENVTNILIDKYTSLDLNLTLEDITNTTKSDEIIETPDSTSKKSTKKFEVFPKIKLSFKKPKINKPQNITTPPSYVPIFKPRVGISKRKQLQRPEENPILDIDSEKYFETLPKQSDISDMNIQLNINGNFEPKSTNPNLSKNVENFVGLPNLIFEQNSLNRIPNETIHLQTAQNAKSEPVQSQNGAKNHIIVLYKPETVTLTKFYGEFMRKLSMTVLVPFYVSKLKKMA